MNRLRPAFLAAFLGLGFLTGCATPHPVCGTQALADLPASPITVWVAEPDLAKKLVIRHQKVEEGPNGATLARVEIVNTSPDILSMEAQTLYKDKTGLTLEMSPWVKYTIKPGKSVWLMAPTIAPGTARFFMQIQPAPLRKPLSGPTLPNFGLVPGAPLRYSLTSC